MFKEFGTRTVSESTTATTFVTQNSLETRVTSWFGTYARVCLRHDWRNESVVSRNSNTHVNVFVPETEQQTYYKNLTIRHFTVITFESE